MLTVSNLHLHYGASHILRGVSLEAKPGQVTCIMGRNGVGKTSLLRAILGLHPSSGGAIEWNGQDVTRMPAHKRARAGFASVPQGRDIFPRLTVAENLRTGFAAAPSGEKNVPEHVFELFPVLKEMLGRRGGDLSGGQQQQLAIARALVMRPKLLVLDEPTEGIQPNIIQQIGRVIAHLRDRGDMAIVLVEQYFSFAYDLGDRFYVMERGAMRVAAGKAEVTREALLDSVSV